MGLTVADISSARKWSRKLKDLEPVKIPRCLKEPSPTLKQLSIRTFSDPSENAYTAVVYARHVYEGGSITTRLVISKSRLAPWVHSTDYD